MGRAGERAPRVVGEPLEGRRLVDEPWALSAATAEGTGQL